VPDDTALAKQDYASVPTIEVRDGKDTIAVPVDTESNRLASRVVGAKLREMMIEQINLVKGGKRAMKAAELKSFVDAVSKVEDINRFAYSPLDLNGNGGGNESARTAEAMMKGAMQGIVSAATHGTDRAKRMRQITKVGKVKEAKDEIVEIQ